MRLKFRVISQSGDGLLYGVSHVQRINTRGGVAQGACDKADSLPSVPYSADYLFWHAIERQSGQRLRIRKHCFESSDSAVPPIVGCVPGS